MSSMPMSLLKMSPVLQRETGGNGAIPSTPNFGCLRIYGVRRSGRPIAQHDGLSNDDIAELLAIYLAFGHLDTHIEVDLDVEALAA